MILYAFITCQARLGRCYNRIQTMMAEQQLSDYLVVLGGSETNHYNPITKQLRLACQDTYEGLADKVISMFRYIQSSREFDSYQYICKMDEDMILQAPLRLGDLTDYCGHVQNHPGNRYWHIGRCSPESPHNTQPYQGPYVPWCLGGHGYVVSKKAVFVLANEAYGKDAKEEIFEDVYVGRLLKMHGIEPNEIPNFRAFIYSPDHT
jgi:hypothetical protein